MKKLYHYILASLLVCAVHFEAFAQGQYMFNHMNTNEGLSCSSVVAVFVDSRGYLWVGTENGLNRFDGYSFKTYYSYGSNSQDLANNILSIQEDAEGKIWIEGMQPYVIYKGGKSGFSTDVAEYIKSLNINVDGMNYKVHVDISKNLYIVSPGHIFYHNFKEGRTEDYPVGLSMQNRDGWTIDDIQNGIVIAHENEIWRFDIRSGNLHPLTLPESMDSPEARYRCYVDRDNAIWVYSTMSEAICRMNIDGTVHIPPTLESEFDSQSNSIRSVLDDDLGHIWIATDHEGVYVFNKRTGEIQNITTSSVNSLDKNGALASNNVTCLFKDRMGTIWLGHLKNGISYTNDYYQIFQSHAQQCGDISTLFTDSKGNLWMGTDGNGLYTQLPDGNIWKAPVPNITISSITECGGDIYVGTYNDGIYRLGQGGAISHMGTADGSLPTNAAWRVTHDKKGKIWMCSAFGTLTSIDSNTGAVKPYKRDDGSDIVGLAMHFDGKKTLYVGTFYGVYALNTETGKGQLYLGNKSGKQDFLNTTITSIYKDDKNQALWIGHLSGITVWDIKSDSIHYIDRSSGLADNYVKSILKDEKGKIWISTGAGISCIQPTYEDGFHAIVRNYSHKDGLTDCYFNGGAACILKSGDLAMGGPQGYTLIRTADAHALALTSSKPIISQVSVGDSIIVADPAFLSEEYGEMVSSIDLEYVDRQITINFFTGNLLNATRVRYAYRLVGMSDEWSYTNDGSISFFSIPAGSYTLEIKACGEDGTWSEVTSLGINVAPPFYASLWAKIFYVLLILVLGFLTYRFLRDRHFGKLAAQKSSMENEQFDRMSKMKQQFFIKMSNELRTPLTLIISPLQTLVNQPLPEDTKQRLQEVLKNAQLLLHQVNMLLDLRHTENAAAGKLFSVPEPMQQETPSEQVMYVPLESAQQRNQEASEPEQPEEVAEPIDPREEAFMNALELAELTRSVADDPTIDDSNAAEAAAQASEDNPIDEEEAQEKNHRFTMLMVDDSPDMCRFVRDYFRGEYNVITASDGEKAVECLKENEGIDLVVSDVTMPKMDGMELCKFIKSDLRWSHIPVILLTGRTDEEFEVQGLKLGADDYITKPFNAEMLRLRVRKFIEKKEIRQRQFKEQVDVAPSEITITSVDEKFIRKAIQICEDNIHDPDFSVESLGQELAMSRTYLYRKLMNITGKGPGEFIRIIRLKRGKQYLEQSQMQITEIAYAIGYSSPKRFTENFRTEFGITPSEYAKKFRTKES